MVAGMKGGCPWSGGGWAGWAAGVFCVHVHGWPWLGSAGLGGVGWLLG